VVLKDALVREDGGIVAGQYVREELEGGAASVSRGLTLDEKNGLELSSFLREVTHALGAPMGSVASENHQKTPTPSHIHKMFTAKIQYRRGFPRIGERVNM
jgi:hypothetical protein